MKKSIERYGTELRIYDNGGKTMDRYTIIPPRYASHYRERDNTWMALSSGVDPKGCSGHCAALPGGHLGKRIHWQDLPESVQRIAMYSFPEYASKGVYYV